MLSYGGLVGSPHPSRSLSLSLSLHTPHSAHTLLPDLTSRFSICIRKAIPLPYDDYLSQCAKSLAETKAAPSDGDLVALLRFTREAETVYTLFNYSETHQTQYMSDEQIHIYLNVFSARLQDWQTDSASLMSRSSESKSL